MANLKPKLVGQAPERKTDLANYQCPFCGKVFQTRPKYVEAGGTKSCGCLVETVRASRKHALDLKGKTIGYLQVIEEIGTDKYQRILWRCASRSNNG